MKMSILFIFIFLLIIKCSYSQTDIFLNEYKVYITPKDCTDSMTHYLRDSSFLKLKLLNCKGAMFLNQYDRNGNLVVTGQYMGSLDTLKEYVSIFSLSDFTDRVEVHKFFQPLKDGEWIYYQKGRESKREKYKRGILIE